MRALLDVNVLIALFDAGCARHVRSWIPHWQASGKLATFDQRLTTQLVLGATQQHLELID